MALELADLKKQIARLRAEEADLMKVVSELSRDKSANKTKQGNTGRRRTAQRHPERETATTAESEQGGMQKESRAELMKQKRVAAEKRIMTVFVPARRP